MGQNSRKISREDREESVAENGGEIGEEGKKKAREVGDDSLDTRESVKSMSYLLEEANYEMIGEILVKVRYGEKYTKLGHSKYNDWGFWEEVTKEFNVVAMQWRLKTLTAPQVLKLIQSFRSRYDQMIAAGKMEGLLALVFKPCTNCMNKMRLEGVGTIASTSEDTSNGLGLRARDAHRKFAIQT